jgi:hypothetical protein
MEQFAPTARLDPQLFANTNEEAFVPVTAMLVMATAEAPVFVKVTLCEALVSLTPSSPNERLVDDSDTVGAPPVTVTVTMLETELG